MVLSFCPVFMEAFMASSMDSLRELSSTIK